MRSQQRLTLRPRLWKPTPVVGASILAHSVALAALLAEPSRWASILGMIGANHALLGCGMHPRSSLLGQNLTRLPLDHVKPRSAVALTFDDGPDPEVTPRILDLLDRYGAKASFFAIGRRVAAWPHLAREIVARGHSVENHTQSHPLSFGAWTPGGMLRELRAAQDSIADACGQEPAFFRAPAGIRNPLLDPVLAWTGLRLVSWTRRGYDAVCANPDHVHARLTRGLSAGDILLLHDRSRGRASTALQVLPRLLIDLRRRDLISVSLRSVRTDATDGAAAAPASALACRGQGGHASR